MKQIELQNAAVERGHEPSSGGADRDRLIAAAHPDRPRLCVRYCNAARAGGESGPLCPHCDQCEFYVRLFSRMLEG